MPEEINRLVTDAIADYLFPPTDLARDHLLREGVSADKIFVVGNVMIDTLFKFRGRAEKTSVLTDLGLTAKSYALMTLHRPSNVDVKENLIALLDAIEQIQEHIQIIFPSHPRTKNTLQNFGLSDRIAGMSNLKIIEPVGYYQFMNLMINAKFVLTDSGGMQEETTVLNVPCLTLRENTERPETVDGGTSTLVGCDTELIVSESLKILEGKGKTGAAPEIWDGHTAERIAEILNQL